MDTRNCQAPDMFIVDELVKCLQFVLSIWKKIVLILCKELYVLVIAEAIHLPVCCYWKALPVCMYNNLSIS